MYGVRKLVGGLLVYLTCSQDENETKETVGSGSKQQSVLQVKLTKVAMNMGKAG